MFSKSLCFLLLLASWISPQHVQAAQSGHCQLSEEDVKSHARQCVSKAIELGKSQFKNGANHAMNSNNPGAALADLIFAYNDFTTDFLFKTSRNLDKWESTIFWAEVEPYLLLSHDMFPICRDDQKFRKYASDDMSILIRARKTELGCL